MKLWTSSWMVLITLLILTAVRYWDPTPVQRLRLLNFDGYQALLEKTTSEQIVLYDIGEEFLKEHGQWPPKRTVLAQLTADLYNAGAGLVVFNILFAEEDRLGGDAVKIVDRMEFSYNNFSPDILKGWDKPGR